MKVGRHDAVAAGQSLSHQLFQALFLHLHNQAQIQLFCQIQASPKVGSPGRAQKRL